MTATRRLLARFAAAGCMALLALAIAGAGGPVAAADPTSTSIRVSFSESTTPPVPNYLVAQLTEPDGSAVADQVVAFFREADLGGTVIVELGRASTDIGGYARLPIVPREEAYAVTVRFEGTPDLGASEVTREISFPAETIQRPEHAPMGGAVDPRLRPLANLMPTILAGAVVVVWLVLLVVSVQAIRGIRSGSQSDQSKVPQQQQG